MTEKREVIRRLRHGHSIRQIQRDTGFHRTIIRRLKELGQSENWLQRSSSVPPESVIEELLMKSLPAPPEHQLDKFQDKLERWLREQKSFVVIHSLLKDEVDISESTVRRYCKKHFPESPKAVFIRPTLPGKIMEVDFGYLGLTYDPTEKRNRKTWVFSGRLRHSRIAWRERVFNQRQETFFRCHIHAFEFFEGVPEKVVPDNLKAAVVKASFTDPVVNRIYLKMAEHYGFLIDPCPPRRPDLKGGVENDIKYIKKNFWPIFKEQALALGNEVPYGDTLQRKLESWSKNTAHVRNLSGVGRRPIDLFLEEEQPALMPLPRERWKEISWTHAKVQETYRIQVAKAWYSVPYKLIGKKVLVYLTVDTVAVYDELELVTMHPRATRNWQYIHKKEHDPPNVEVFMKSTREGILNWAGQMGKEVELTAKAILNRRGVDGLRPARALLALHRKYGKDRLCAACRRAIYFDSPEYTMVKSILAQGLDYADLTTPLDSHGNLCFNFARSPVYFLPEKSVGMEVRQ